MIAQFKKDVLEGLSQSPQKTLPAKYFYDERGDALFVKIMAMPEYYLTNAEMDIFKHQHAALIEALGMDKSQYFELIELGAGDGTKTVELLKALLKADYPFSYIPVDISQNALEGLDRMLRLTLPSLKTSPRHCDYFEALEQLKQDGIPKIILFLGSNIGNLSDEQATEFIYQLGANLQVGDQIMLGVDLIKSSDIVLPAYNDAQGITREFNLNLLDRINRELGADFDRNEFEHLPVYDEKEGIAKSFLASKIDQQVHIDGHCFHFSAGETIHTEISRKYNDEVIHCILQKTDFTVEAKILDRQSLFADYILKRN